MAGCPTTGAALTGATMTGRSDTPVTAVAPFTPKKDPLKRRCRQSTASLRRRTTRRRRAWAASLAPTEEAVSTPMNASPMNAAQVPHVVMVVDDDAFQLSVQAQKVRELGHTVIEVGGGAQALAILATRDVDLAIIDINMLGVDGCGVARAVRAGLTRRGRAPSCGDLGRRRRRDVPEAGALERVCQGAALTADAVVELARARPAHSACSSPTTAASHGGCSSATSRASGPARWSPRWRPERRRSPSSRPRTDPQPSTSPSSTRDTTLARRAGVTKCSAPK